ncbi:MAG: DUF5522 domain-containing protein [Bacteroidetes bacterium]|jgi:hypothetical protein|nr:DUF5522 domain-containing protein [Bacteroidota bacterium]
MRESKKLKEGEDYYLNEQGLMVLTAEYLARRGYCCGSGCRHCPYPKEVFEAARAKKRADWLWGGL